MDMKEDTEPERIEKKRTHGKWKDAHVVLFVLLVVLTILFPGGGIFYLCGRFRPYASTLGGVFLLYLVVCVFILYCFVSGIVELAGRRGKRTRNERLLIAAATGVPLIFVGLLMVPFFCREASCGPGLGLLIVGLRGRIESKAYIGATRAWLQSFNVEDLDDRYNLRPGYSLIPRSEWPRSLRVLKPEGVVLSADKNGNAKVRLDWGSGMMGHWGVEIGMENMEIPPSDFGLHGEYRLPLEPGVYVWRGD